MDPRHFLRRLIAAVIDIVIFSQLAVYLVAPFADGNTYRLSGGLYQFARCQVVPLTPDARAYAREQGIEAQNGSLCRTYQNGLFSGRNLLISSHTNAKGDIADDATTLTLALGADGVPVSPVFPVGRLQPVLMLLFFILLTYFWNGQTPGKKITGIQLRTITGQKPAFWQVARRESLKFAPAILLYFISMVSTAFSLEHVVHQLKSGESIALVFGFLGGATFIYILWWVAPMLWWNGAMPYDRIGKTKIIRAS